MIGRNLGNYRVIEQIGMGGMATVYKAYDPDTDRYVAIKVLPEHFSQDPTFRQRFEREAKAIAKLEHIHILPLFAYGEDNGTAYMVMRYLKAGSLTDRIRAGALSFDEASRLLSQIASALDHAHANGVLHRDVKPSNVLLDADGNAFLTDFGIAKMVESAVDLTGGGILGTPAYMSPEQCRGNTELTPASDQYSLGIILYEMLTGRAPFQAETPIALIHMQLSDPLPMPRQIRSDLPEQAERVILKSLTKEPNLRYPTCGEMAAAFARSVAQVTVSLPPADDVTLAAGMSITTTDVVGDRATVLRESPTAAESVKPKRKVAGWLWAVIAVVLLVLLAGVIVGGLFLFGGQDEPAVTVHEDDQGEIVADVGQDGTTPEEPADEEPVGEEPAAQQPEMSIDEVLTKYREVRPCDWDGYGPGLCIYTPPREKPAFKILQDAELEITSGLSWSPHGEEIVFSAIPKGGNPNGDFALYRVHADGTELTKMPQLSNDLYPDWSPDGEGFAFHSGCDLAVMNSDGSDQEILWQHDVDWCVEVISWSPDSDAVVVSVVPTGEFHFPLERQIWYYSPEEMYPIQTTISESEECAHFEVAFSPDGEQVVYFDGCRPMIVDASGYGQPRPIVDFPYSWLGMAYPRWEGERPEFVEAEFDREMYAEPAGMSVEYCDDMEPPQICIRNVETGEIFEVTHDLDFEAIYDMTWSPDGEQILFDAGREFGHDIYVINVDGSGLRPVVETQENEVFPVWSPTGEWIAFHRSCGLGLVRPDGSEERVLHDHDETFCVANIGWSPDGQYLAVLNYRGEENPPGEVWLFNLEGDGEIVFDFDPQGLEPWGVNWDPQGKEVVFLFSLHDDRAHGVMIYVEDDKPPREFAEDEFDRLQMWTWWHDYWPQWGVDR